MIKRGSKDTGGYYSADDDVSFERMTREQEMELFVRFQQEGDLEARDRILKNQLLFIAGESLRLAPDWLPVDEVISAGNFAALKAMDKFDPTHGVRFTSYVRKFIHGEIVRVCREKSTVYLPNGRAIPATYTWSDQEILPEETLEPTPPPDPANEVAAADHAEYLEDAVRTALDQPNITDLEKHVVIEHFFDCKTFQQIANDMPSEVAQPGLTRQRIGQVKLSACAKLKINLAKQGIRGIL